MRLRVVLHPPLVASEFGGVDGDQPRHARTGAPPARPRRPRASRGNARGRSPAARTARAALAHVGVHLLTQRTKAVGSLGKGGSRTRCTRTPWRSSSTGSWPPPRVSTWTSTPSGDQVLGELADMAPEAALDHRRILPGDQQDAHRAAGHPTGRSTSRTAPSSTRLAPGPAGDGDLDQPPPAVDRQRIGAPAREPITDRQRSETAAGSATATVTPASWSGALRCAQSGPPHRHALRPAGVCSARRSRRPCRPGAGGPRRSPRARPRTPRGRRLRRRAGGRRQIIDLDHDHVAAVVAAPLEQGRAAEASARSGRDDLQERVAEREHGVAQPEVVDAWVGEGARRG